MYLCICLQWRLDVFANVFFRVCTFLKRNATTLYINTSEGDSESLNDIRLQNSLRCDGTMIKEESSNYILMPTLFNNSCLGNFSESAYPGSSHLGDNITYDWIICFILYTRLNKMKYSSCNFVPKCKIDVTVIVAVTREF